MLKFYGTGLLFAALLGGGAAFAGDAVVPRQEFRQSRTYPYVFRPVCYLATKGPVPLRFATSGPECDDRKPPKLPVTAKPEVKAEASPAAQPAPIPAEPEVAHSSSTAQPAFPAPTNAPAPKPPTVDFSKFPPELVEAFRRQRDSNSGGDARNYLFDPIFQPALPDDLPKSSATYRQK